MQDDILDFEKRLKKELQEFTEKKEGTFKPIRKPQVGHVEKGYRVILNVRTSRMSFIDEKFVIDVPTISKLEAKIEAEQKARSEGWPIIGCVFSIEKL